MNPIVNAIDKGWHETKIEKLRKSNWSTFEKAAVGKKLFLLGLGNGLLYFYEKYRRQYKMFGLIDNDSKKNETYAEELLEYWTAPEYQHLQVQSLDDVLREYDKGEIVIIITSLRHYQEIAHQLEAKDIDCYFSLLVMESKLPQEALYEFDVRLLRTFKEYCFEYQSLDIEKKKIVFYTTGKYSGHGKAIAEALLEIRNDLDIVWLVDDLRTEVPCGIRVVWTGNRRKHSYELSTAKMWIYDQLVTEDIEKRKEQIYIQIKHWSSVTLKEFWKAMCKYGEYPRELELCERNSQMIDYLLVGSDFDERISREGLGYDGEAVHVGSARTDVLFHDNNCREKVIGHYNLKTSDRHILYVPTFRQVRDEYGRADVPPMVLDFDRLRKTLGLKFGGNWTILMKLHPFVANRQSEIKLEPGTIGVSDYDDVQELIIASDVIVTDYSSIMFEPAYIKKPVFLYAPDRKEYINGERGLLIPYDTLPFPIAESNDELEENIRNFDQAAYEADVTAFLDSYGVHEDGHASERAAKFISELISQTDDKEKK